MHFSALCIFHMLSLSYRLDGTSALMNNIENIRYLIAVFHDALVIAIRNMLMCK